MRIISQAIIILSFLLLTTIPKTFFSQTKLSNGNYLEKVGDLYLNFTIKSQGPVMIVGHLASGKIGYELSLQPLEKHFTMVYYEPRGTGLSQLPETLEEYEIEFIVQEIDALRQVLGTDKIWIWGHSDQSAVALIYALQFPYHTSGLILSGTSMVGTQEKSSERRLLFEQKRSNESAWFLKNLNDWDYMINNQTSIGPNGEDLSYAPVKWWCYDENSSKNVIKITKEIAKAGRRQPINGLMKIETELERQQYLEYQKSFHNIQTQILIINGKYDTNNPPEYAEALHNLLPNSTLKFIEKAGHFPWVENPDTSFKIIEDRLKNIATFD